MTPFVPVGETAAAIVALAGIARERMRAYGLPQNLFDVRALAIAAGATAMRGWLAWRGIGGFDTSIVIATGAVAAITDLQSGCVFDRTLLAACAALIVVSAVRESFVQAIAGGAVCATLLGILWVASRRRGVGFGDVKLAGVLGCGLGPWGALNMLWFAFTIGAFAAVVLVLCGRRTVRQALPFAPFLALGTMLSLGCATP